MAFFIATGVISNDIVRRETRKGVLTTFRLQTGAPRGGRLWIDIECWGHLAGTIAHHATKGRGVSVGGRLTQKNWRDTATGEARDRYVITANDIDLHPTAEAVAPRVPNSVLLNGTVEAIHPHRTVKNGVISSIRVSSGKASAKAGRLEIDVERWHSTPTSMVQVNPRTQVSIGGSLVFGSPEVGKTISGIYIWARHLSTM